MKCCICSCFNAKSHPTLLWPQGLYVACLASLSMGFILGNEWVAISYSRHQTCISCIGMTYHCTTAEAPWSVKLTKKVIVSVNTKALCNKPKKNFFNLWSHLIEISTLNITWMTEKHSKTAYLMSEIFTAGIENILF